MRKNLLLFGMLFIPILYFAQVSKQQAINLVMEKVVGSNSTNVNVYMEPVLQMDFYYKMSHYDSIASPYSNYWLFFIDDMPGYGWGHDCRYVFVNSDCGIISITNSHIPPYHRKLYLEIVSEPVTFVIPPINIDTTKQTLVNYDYPSNNGKYALLFTGGEIFGDNHTAFWNALCHSYCGLLENGFKKENVFVLSCDGGMANRSLDFDQDGQPDIMSDTCNLHGIVLVLDSLSSIMQEEDILYIYGAMHGDTVGDNTYLCLWDGGRWYDYQLANMLSRIRCSQYIVNIYSCYSGGMAEEIIAIPNDTYKTVLTCRDNQPVMRNLAYMQYAGMDVYNYFINTAFRNYHPVYPDSIWNKGNMIGELQDTIFFSVLNPSLILNKDINYDSIVYGGNGNGNHEIGEIINYTSHFDPHQFGLYGIKHYECGFDTSDDLLSLRGITGSVTRTQAVKGNFHIEDTLSVFADTLTIHNCSKFYLFDADLIIEDAASLIMGDTSSIIARSGDCRVIVKGSLVLGKGVTFEARDGATLEIIFENDADLVVSNAMFINCSLVLPERNLSFDHCSFFGTPLAMDNSSAQSISDEKTAAVTNCTFSPNGLDINTALYINHFAHYKVIGCTIGSNDGGTFNYGMAIYYSGSNTGWKLVSGNVVSGCLQAGVQMYASSGSITKNTVYGNGYGIKLLNNCNITSFSGLCSATLESNTQFIHDNIKNEVYMTGSSIPQRFRYNAIHHNGNTHFVCHDAYIAFGGGVSRRGSIDVKHNYWGSGFVPTTHLYTNLVGGVYEYNPVWVLGDCSNAWVDDALLLNEADSLNAAGAYSEAQSAYKQVVEGYPESVSAETALKSLLTLETNLEGDYETLQKYYLSNECIAGNEILSHLASSLANKCDEKMGNYEKAIEWYENVLTDTNTSFNDSIFASIDLGDLYSRMEINGEKGICGKWQQYVPESRQMYKTQRDYALSLLPNEKASPVEIMNIEENFPPVSNLSCQIYDNDTVLLSWNIPTDAEEAVISWSDMTCFTGIGFATVFCAIDHAARFDSNDLASFVGWHIKDVSVILSETDTMYGMPQDQHYYARIWKGTDEAPQQVYEKEIVHPVYSVPLTVSVDSIVYIENDNDLLIGYHIDKYRRFPCVVDAVSAAPQGKGINYMLYHNDLNDDCVADQRWIDDTWPEPWGNLCVAATIASSERKSDNKSRTASLTGYRIYRDGSLIKEIPYSFVTNFADTEFSKGFDVEYCVTAVYGDEESEPVCFTANVTGVGNAAEALEITVAPNPTNGLVTIKGKNLCRAKVVNMLGQQFVSITGDGDELQIDMASLPVGVYFIEIADTQGKWCVKKVMKE